MTEEHLLRITKAFFHQVRHGMDWDGCSDGTKQSWRKMVNAVVIELDKGTPLGKVADAAWPHYYEGTRPSARSSEWDRCVEFVIGEYLLTPRNK